MTLHRTQMKMVSWMCYIKLQDRAPSKGFRVRLALDGIISVLQQNKWRWYGHVLSKENNDWVKNCVEYEMQGARGYIEVEFGLRTVSH